MLKAPRLLNNPQFLTSPLRTQHREALGVEIEKIFSTMTLDDIIEKLDKCQIANSQMRNVHEALDHPQWKHQEQWTTVDSSVGPLKTLKPVVKFQSSLIAEPHNL